MFTNVSYRRKVRMMFRVTKYYYLKYFSYDFQRFQEPFVEKNRFFNWELGFTNNFVSIENSLSNSKINFESKIHKRVHKL